MNIKLNKVNLALVTLTLLVTFAIYDHVEYMTAKRGQLADYGWVTVPSPGPHTFQNAALGMKHTDVTCTSESGQRFMIYHLYTPRPLSDNTKILLTAAWFSGAIVPKETTDLPIIN